MLVLLGQALERVPIQSIVLRVLEAALDLALMLGRIRLRRNKYCSIVGGEQLQLRNSAEIVKRVLDRRDEIVRCLMPNDFAVSLAGTTQHAPEQFNASFAAATSSEAANKPCFKFVSDET